MTLKCVFLAFLTQQNLVSMKQRILLVEDEQNILDAIKLNLELENYEVTTATNGTEALARFKEACFNLIILDIMIPEIDGLTVCEKIRLENTDTPVLFLTAKDASEDIITGLKKGADDYITKPFVLEEFLLRVAVLIRHSNKGTEQEKELKTFTFGLNKVNFSTYEAVGNNGKFNLTNKEVKLLKLLIDRANQVVSREQILQFVWGYDVFPTTRTIDNFILNFRKNFEENPKEPKYFQSVRGVGYKFVYEMVEHAV